MSQSKIDEQVRLLNAFIEKCTGKHEVKPVGTPGSFAYIASKTTIYKTNLAKFKEEVLAKAAKICDNFLEEYDGELKLLDAELKKVISHGLMKFMEGNDS